MAPRIGVFDSGIGGITVLDALIRAIPGAEFTYLGDTANVPYGSKSPQQIRQLSLAAALRVAAEGLDLLVVACNTASSWALDEIRAVLPTVPVLGVVEPGARAALAASESRGNDGPVLLLATRATVASGAYRRAWQAVSRGAGPRLTERACPLLVPMIEEGWVEHPILEATLREYVRGEAESGQSGVVLLGCTHYPWIQAAVERALPRWSVVNPASELAREARTLLGRSAGPELALERTPVVRWCFTDPAVVPAFASSRFEPSQGAPVLAT